MNEIVKNLNQVWLKLARWFWGFFKIDFTLTLLHLSPLREGLSSFEQTYPPPLDNLCHILFKFAHRFWRRRCKNVTDERKRSIRKAQLSFRLRWVQKSKCTNDRQCVLSGWGRCSLLAPWFLSCCFYPLVCSLFLGYWSIDETLENLPQIQATSPARQVLQLLMLSG
jgi:hypothetical protein